MSISARVLESKQRTGSYGESDLTVVDRFGVYLSRRAVVKAIGNRHDFDILDLGCGHHASLLRSLGPRLRSGVGVDLHISREAKNVESLFFHEASLESSLPEIPSGSFDVVAMLSVLEHLWEPLSVLRDIYRVVRPGGVVLINVPTWRGKPFLEFSAFRLGTSPAEEMNDHKRYYDKRDLWPLLVQAGFRPRNIRMKYHKFGLNLFATVRHL